MNIYDMLKRNEGGLDGGILFLYNRIGIGIRSCLARRFDVWFRQGFYSCLVMSGVGFMNALVRTGRRDEMR